MPDLPELDAPPANGVFVDWEQEREDDARRKRSIRSFVAVQDPDEVAGNLMGETIDPDDDWDNGLDPS